MSGDKTTREQVEYSGFLLPTGIDWDSTSPRRQCGNTRKTDRPAGYKRMKETKTQHPMERILFSTSIFPSIRNPQKLGPLPRQRLQSREILRKHQQAQKKREGRRDASFFRRASATASDSSVCPPVQTGKERKSTEEKDANEKETTTGCSEERVPIWAKERDGA